MINQILGGHLLYDAAVGKFKGVRREGQRCRFLLSKDREFKSRPWMLKGLQNVKICYRIFHLYYPSKMILFRRLVSAKLNVYHFTEKAFANPITRQLCTYSIFLGLIPHHYDKRKLRRGPNRRQFCQQSWCCCHVKEPHRL